MSFFVAWTIAQGLASFPRHLVSVVDRSLRVFFGAVGNWTGDAIGI
jgi:hypothetical protein